MERDTETRPELSHVSSGGVRTGEPGALAGADQAINPGPPNEPGESGTSKEPAERQPRTSKGRFQKADRAGRYNENLARQADARREAERFKAEVLKELGGSVDSSKEPLLDALCETKVRAEAFRRKGRVNKFLEESERYVRLAYMLGLVKAGQHAEKPPPREMPARDHAEWIEMRRKRKR